MAHSLVRFASVLETDAKKRSRHFFQRAATQPGAAPCVPWWSLRPSLSKRISSTSKAVGKPMICEVHEAVNCRF